MAYVVAKPEVEAKFENILVAHHYLDVFVEVTNLPSDREIEFTIKLMPRTQPIHKARFRIAPTELRELKEQLQELFDRGFIRSSVFPWRASVLFMKKKNGSIRLCIDY